MRTVCMILIAAASFAVCGGYAVFGKKRIAEYEGFLSLMDFARGQVGCFLRPIGEWKDEFSADSLEKSGFLPAFRESGSIYTAFEECKHSLSMSDEAILTVGRFLRDFGKGYREDELRRIDYYRAELARMTAAEKEEIPKTAKLVDALTVTASLSLFVLLL